MNVLILSPFKTGTTSLYVTFKEVGIDVLKLHDFDHTFHTNYSHVFLVSRNQNDLYISGFFQDISNPQFAYYFGTKEEVLSANIDDLVNHFKNIDWSQYEHLNVSHHVNLLKKYFDVDVPIDNDYYIIKKNYTYFIHVKLEKLSEMFKKICELTELPIVELQIHNSYEYKWYGDIYQQFRTKLK